MELNVAVQIEETATRLGLRQKLNFQATELASLLTIALPRGFLVSGVLQRASVIHLFFKMARKADEAVDFMFVQSIEQEPGGLTLQSTRG
jgi:hypothetical protein